MFFFFLMSCQSSHSCFYIYWYLHLTQRPNLLGIGVVSFCTCFCFIAASVSNDEVHVCQLCGSWYETRKGLSSHARAHLRQIGIPDSEIKSAPIDYLYQIMKEQDLKPISAERQEELKPTSPSKSSSKRPFDVSSSPASTPSKRPKTSADFTCVLCGEEFENRKGLGSHARSHLRHIGVSDLVGKSNAISAVEELVSSGMLEPVRLPKLNSAASSSAAPSPAPASPVVPGKQSKTSFSPVCLSPSPTSSQSPQPLLNKAPKAKKGFRLAVDPLHRKPKPEPVETEVFIQPKPSSSDSSSSMQKVSTAPISKKPSDAGKAMTVCVCFFFFTFIRLWMLIKFYNAPQMSCLHQPSFVTSVVSCSIPAKLCRATFAPICGNSVSHGRLGHLRSISSDRSCRKVRRGKTQRAAGRRQQAKRRGALKAPGDPGAASRLRKELPTPTQGLLIIQ